jgi:hypothetical protein
MRVFSNSRAHKSSLKPKTEFLVVVGGDDGIYGADEAGSKLPVLSTLNTGGGSHREPLRPSSPLLLSARRRCMMKITEQFAIAWIRGDEASADELVAVHSRPISSADADEAWRKFENGNAIEGFIPIVFLDEQLNSSELRSWLQAEAIHRCHLI